MSDISFIKMSGAGNDFIIIDNRKGNYQFSANQIANMANRNNIGCDQFILMKNSDQSDVFMDIYNADGSSSSACGNATRCVASLIMEEKNDKFATIQTAAAILECQKEGSLISVNMGKPKFDWQEIPIIKKVDTNSFNIDNFDYEFSAVNVGNPHIITFLNEEISDKDFFLRGPLIENHQFFPEKANVEFAKILTPNHILVRVWERGVGETMACGSGACAVGVAAIRRGLIPNQKVKISFKGGDLFIDWQENNDIIMSGGYKKIFSAVLDKDFFSNL